MKTFKLIAKGGLANRMKAIISAKRIADLTDRMLIVKWWPVIDWWPRPGVKEEIPWPDPPDWLNLNFTDEDLVPGRHCPVDWNVVRKIDKSDIVMQTWRWIHFDDEHDLDNLYSHVTQTHMDLQPWVKEFFNVCETIHDIGVHYRRHHHFVTHSPLVPLKLIETNQDRNVFFATDDKPTSDFVTSHYPSVFQWHSKTFDIRQDLINSHTLMDLMSLAKSDYLFGSRHSTFLDLAWHISGFKPITIYEDMNVHQ